MTTYLLPTADIVREFKQYDAVFYFYEEGIKGIVRDVVLFSTGNDPEAGIDVKQMVMNRVNEEIDRHDLIRYYENTHGSQWPTLVIELIIEQIEQAVRVMLDSIFMQLFYEVSWKGDSYDWLGDDMMAKIRILRKNYATRHAYSRLLTGT